MRGYGQMVERAEEFVSRSGGRRAVMKRKIRGQAECSSNAGKLGIKRRHVSLIDVDHGEYKPRTLALARAVRPVKPRIDHGKCSALPCCPVNGPSSSGRSNSASGATPNPRASFRMVAGCGWRRPRSIALMASCDTPERRASSRKLKTRAVRRRMSRDGSIFIRILRVSIELRRGEPHHNMRVTEMRPIHRRFVARNRRGDVAEGRQRQAPGAERPH